MAAQTNRSYLITPTQHTTRVAFAFFAWLLMLLVVISITMLIIPLPILALGLGLCLWLLLVAQTLNHFLVGVPEVTGLITINWFLQPQEFDPYYNQKVYPTGLWFKFPWETVVDDLFINLRLLAQEHDEDYPAKDGPLIEIRGVITYRPDIRLLPRYIAVDSSVINRGLVDIVTGILSEKVSRSKAKTARGKVSEYQSSVLKKFEEDMQDLQGGSIEAQIALHQGAEPTFEWVHGIDMTNVVIGDADYGAAYQKVLSDQARSKLISELAEKIQEERGLSPKDAMNAALLQYEITSKEIFEVEGNAHQALAAILASIGRGGAANQNNRRNN